MFVVYRKVNPFLWKGNHIFLIKRNMIILLFWNWKRNCCCQSVSSKQPNSAGKIFWSNNFRTSQIQEISINSLKTTKVSKKRFRNVRPRFFTILTNVWIRYQFYRYFQVLSILTTFQRESKMFMFQKQTVTTLQYTCTY